MIIDNTNCNNKFDKKLMPKSFEIKVSFLSFINTDEEQGIVLYLKDDFWQPFGHSENVKLKKSKIKFYGDLIKLFDETRFDENQYIKNAKTDFFSQFETSCSVEKIDELFQLELINDEIKLIKNIICVTKDVENLERSFNGENPCLVFPLNEINLNIQQKTVINWLKYFFINFNK